MHGARWRCRGLAGAALAVLAACERARDEVPAADPSGGAGIAFFRDVTSESGVAFRVTHGAAGERYLVETMLGGLGWIDVDSDGDPDLYLVNGHERPERGGQPGEATNRIFINDGSGVFADRTEEVGGGDPGYGFGLASGDWDGDGDADLFVANLGRDTLYRNDGGRLVDVTEDFGLGAEDGWSSSAAFLDFDRDGDLDLFVARYLRYRPGVSRRCVERGVAQYCHPRFFAGLEDLLWRNDGDRFVEVGREAGIAIGASGAGKGLGVVVFDQDRDGWVDIYVANDTTPNSLFRNRGDGTFEDQAASLGVAVGADARAEAGMGVDIGDLDRDGRTEIVVTNFSGETNALYRPQGDDLYREVSASAGLGRTRASLGFGVGILDFDLDGDADLVFANGHIDDLIESNEPGSGHEYRQLPQLWRNDGRGRFDLIGAEAGPFFSEAIVARGLALADFDGDGDVDIAVAAIDRPVVLLRNEAREAHRAVSVRLRGTRSTRDAVGARVAAQIGERTQTFEYGSTRSYLSASDPRVTIGLGSATAIDRLTVSWPSGEETRLEQIPAGARLELEEPARP